MENSDADTGVVGLGMWEILRRPFGTLEMHFGYRDSSIFSRHHGLPSRIDIYPP